MGIPVNIFEFAHFNTRLQLKIAISMSPEYIAFISIKTENIPNQGMLASEFFKKMNQLSIKSQ